MPPLGPPWWKILPNLAIAGGRDLEASLGELEPEHVPDVWLVVDHQSLRCIVHGGVHEILADNGGGAAHRRAAHSLA